jgi:hypothetical protein
LRPLAVGWRATVCYLDPASSTKEQKQDDDQEHDAETATAVVANAGTHVVAAATEYQQKNHENKN